MTDKPENYWLMCDCPEIQEANPYQRRDQYYRPDIRWYLEHIEGVTTISRDKRGYYWIDSILYGASFEIALLKHYMRITHNKEWNGKEWVKI